MRKHLSYYIFLLTSLLAACTPKVENAVLSDKQPNIYPDYVGVTIPAEIAPMNFCMAEDADAMDVVVKGSKGGELHITDEWADFNINEWHSLLTQNIGGELSFTVTALQNDKWTQYKAFKMFVSKHPLKDYGITYRKIAPGFQTFSDIGIYQRCLQNFEEEAIFDVKDVDGQCMNCHYANRGNPKQFLVHVRGMHGATYVRNNDKEDYLNTKTDSTCGSCTYGYWHPEGKYCAFSLNRAMQNFYTDRKKIIEPWDEKSDIVVLDVEKNQLIRSTLLEGDDFQTTPAFSADGKTIYFSAAPAVENMPADYEKVKYSLCKIDFDASTGKFGEEVDTLISGGQMDKSIALPRPSYDGKWLMYCITDYGTTPINRIESDLYLLNLSTMESRCMTEINSKETDAYHNWSTSSRWFVFGSKREDHLYSLPYFACINDDGKATKPFLLPQRNPKEYYLENLHSYNVPDFTSGRVELDRNDFSSKVMSDDRIQVQPLPAASPHEQ